MVKKHARQIPENRRIALIVESSGSAGRELLRGVARYAREKGNWSIYYEPSHIPDVVPTWLNRWRGDGLLARVRNRKMAARLLRMGLPVVDVLGNMPEWPFPLVQVDDAGVASLAAEHLLERGFRKFAYCAIGDSFWAQCRGEAFCNTIGARGHSCEVYQLPRRDSREWYSDALRRRLGDWVQRLPKPIAIFASNDRAGHRVLEACRSRGLAVPEEVAVLGVDNDQTICELCDPMLSSIVPVHDQVGYRAAELLDRLIAGHPPAERPVFLQPTRVMVRQSTDVLALEDPDVAAAVRFIRQHACRGIGVEDVARHVALSGSTLQRRFHRDLSRSVHEEIIRARIQRASELLADTQMPLAQIAQVTGFEHQEYLGAVFKVQTGFTPGEYRSRALRPTSDLRTA